MAIEIKGGAREYNLSRNFFCSVKYWWLLGQPIKVLETMLKSLASLLAGNELVMAQALFTACLKIGQGLQAQAQSHSVSTRWNLTPTSFALLNFVVLQCKFF